MIARRQIQTQITQPDVVEYIRQLIASNPAMHRTEIADRLCAEFGFRDARGVPQRSGCLKVLRTLEEKGYLVLPAPRARSGPARPRRLGRRVPSPEGVPGTVGEVRGLELVVVQTEEQMRIWNELFTCEHPWGAGPLVGRQVRYLIRSEHGWLGGMGFASAALQVRDRDRWIGWDVKTRRAQLDRVVSLSRFLIRPSVVCRNLASYLLGMVMRQMPEDFQARYGYRPWLVETFVDTSRHVGTSYQAANWIRVGRTKGRGRQDRKRLHGETVKDIYLYPLVRDFRDRMGLSLHSGLGPLPLEAGLESEGWAEQEFGGAPLGDRRLSKRLVNSVALQSENPGRAFTGVAQGDWAMTKGYYRFIDQPDDSAVTMENILLPHREQTVRRMQAQGTVLCIQDGSTLDYTALSECEGLGMTGKNQTGAKSQGLHMHTTLAVTDDGLPLGVLRAQCWAPVSRSEDQRKSSEIAKEEKKSYRWIEGLRDCMSAAADTLDTRVISVMDREADIFDLFDQWRKGSHVDLLIRARHNRRTVDGNKIFDIVRETEPQSRFHLHVNRQSVRPKKSKQKARPKRSERSAEVALRWQRVEVCPPDTHKHSEPVTLWVVHIVEEEPPEGVKPLEWFLLTTLKITSSEQARQCLTWYCLRWRIEDFYRTLKTGCRILELRHKTAERLKRAIAINSVIAWRIMLMTLLGRETPEMPATLNSRLCRLMRNTGS